MYNWVSKSQFSFTQIFTQFKMCNLFFPLNSFQLTGNRSEMSFFGFDIRPLGFLPFFFSSLISSSISSASWPAGRSSGWSDSAADVVSLDRRADSARHSSGMSFPASRLRLCERVVANAVNVWDCCAEDRLLFRFHKEPERQRKDEQQSLALLQILS